MRDPLIRKRHFWNDVRRNQRIAAAAVAYAEGAVAGRFAFEFVDQVACLGDRQAGRIVDLETLGKQGVQIQLAAVRDRVERPHLAGCGRSRAVTTTIVRLSGVAVTGRRHTGGAVAASARLTGRG